MATTTVRVAPRAATGPNAATLPVARDAPWLNPLHLFLPAGWNAGTGIWDDTGSANMDLTTHGTSTPAPATVDGVSVLTFDGNDVLYNLAAAIPQPFTTIAVFKPTAAPASGRACILSLGETTNIFAPSVRSGGDVGTRLGSTDILPLSGTSRINQWVTSIGVFNGASSVANQDGTELAGTFGTTAADMLAVGCDNASYATSKYVGHIAALMVVGKALDAAERAAMRSYINTLVGRP